MVIDFHVHAFNPKIAKKAIDALALCCKTDPLTDGLITTTCQRMDEWGVDKACLLSIATKPAQQRLITDWAAELDRDRFYPFMSLHPDADNWEEELSYALSKGLVGLKLHPDYQGFFVDDEKYDAFFEAVEKTGIPVVIHSGFDPVSPEVTHCDPERSKRLIERHRHMKLVLAHLGGNYMYEQVLDTLAGIDGEVYFDTAYAKACNDDMLAKIIDKHGADRILFASDCPWDSPKDTLEKLERLDISDDKMELILCKNALRLLEI